MHLLIFPCFSTFVNCRNCQMYSCTQQFLEANQESSLYTMNRHQMVMASFLYMFSLLLFMSSQVHGHDKGQSLSDEAHVYLSPTVINGCETEEETNLHELRNSQLMQNQDSLDLSDIQHITLPLFLLPMKEEDAKRFNAGDQNLKTSLHASSISALSHRSQLPPPPPPLPPPHRPTLARQNASSSHKHKRHHHKHHHKSPPPPSPLTPSTPLAHNHHNSPPPANRNHSISSPPPNRNHNVSSPVSSRNLNMSSPPPISRHHNISVSPPPADHRNISMSPASSRHHRNTSASPPHPSLPPSQYPPPPKEDCDAIVCLPPLTKTPFMSPCGCVRPIQVKIELSVPLYALFPLISVLATDLAEGTVLSPNQVEIMGANANSQDPDNSIVDVNLVPLDEEFDNLTALIIFQKLWNHEVVINSTLFGNYSVIYVRYPGLPSSPPAAGNDTGGLDVNGSPKQTNPFGVNVNKRRHKLDVWVIVVIIVSTVIGLLAALGCFWCLLLKFSRREAKPVLEPGLISTRTKRSGVRSVLSSDLGSSNSMSFTSSMATYASTAKTFTFAELERATDKFKPENVIGEGGFGRVYSGILDDGTKAAVKVLTRDQGGREFIAEVEMLSRLHHRNLVKLIGICTEDHNRCLVYELIPNGSVESHLHGIDKDLSPLDWDARMKIALGAARGLAYLHEDSTPRVIHRDFKASNILLENDFTPKVSDFGLAKAAPDEGRDHLSTRVMGTFGYVAPEYAMTGHLLVKSDVYSYGVVLLELLTGRKPVDMSQPPGQENLVTWARPLLTNKEGLDLLVDPALRGNFPPDNLARVAAIASMCVQPEVSHRPFMGEVVQALKLVYNDGDLQNGTGSSNASQGGDSGDVGHNWIHQGSHYMFDNSTSFLSVDYDSGPSQIEYRTAVGRPNYSSSLFPDSREMPKTERRHSLSGPLRPSRSKRAGYKIKGLNKQGSLSEHAVLASHFGTGLDRSFTQMFP